MSINWSDEYKLGFAEIDEQHQGFLNILNQLYDAIASSATKTSLTPVFDKLHQYTTVHFQTEEKYFAEFNFAGAADHIAKHQEFIKRIADLQSKLNQDELTVSFELIDFLEDWLLDHVAHVDRLYVECFSSHGLK